MKKFLAVITIICSLFFVGRLSEKEVKAEVPDFPVLTLGAGKQLLNPNDVTMYRNEYGYVEIFIYGWIVVPPKELYVLYFSGDISGNMTSEDVAHTEQYYPGINKYLEDEPISVYPGGWGGYILIHNYENVPLYFALTGLVLNKTAQNVDPYGQFMLQKESSDSKREFVGYYDYISPSSNLKQATDGLSYVTYKGKTVSNEQILSLFHANDNTANGVDSISIESNNYRDEIGNYEAKIKALDKNGNASYYTLGISVIPYTVPTISGDETINVKLSEITNFTIDTLYSKYSASYGSQSYTFTLSDYESFYRALDKVGSTALTLIATFSGGKTVTKTIYLNVVDDIAPDIYVSQLVLETSVLKRMSTDEIMDYIESSLSANNISSLSNVVITENNYEGCEDVAGSHVVYFTYESEGETHEGSVVINVANENISTITPTKDNDNQKEIIIISTVGVSLGLIALTIYKSKKNKKHVI